MDELDPIVEVDPVFGPIDVTCPNEACENFGITLNVLVNMNAPSAVCGPCGGVLSPIDPSEVTPT